VQTALLVLLVLLAVKLMVELFLSRLNRGSVESSRSNPPEVAREILDDETFQKSVDYNLSKSRFGSVEDVYEAALLAFVLSIGLPWAHAFLTPVFSDGPWGQGLVVIIILLLLQLPNLPFEWHNQFRIEERFGFNKSTPGLWISDKVKGTILGFVIGYPLVSALLWCAQSLGPSWWIWGFIAFFGFQLLLMVLWPMLILPLFNKLEPLPEGELRDRLMALSDRAGFRAQAIQVIDGSKRSAHSNAFFTGFGRFRRIVLFDTLIEQLEPTELEAVLAHEIGHYKKGHVPKALVLSAVLTGGGFWCLDQLAQSAWFYEHFGFEGWGFDKGMGPAFLLFSLGLGAFTFWITPLKNLWSRKNEFEADAFAREAMDGPESLVAALRKLYKENLGNLTPHPAFSGFYYSHPVLPEREAALRAD
tara:strand:+ start:5036 stop:6286 length:1251 start_codon:yes stop_codon:yes gene_type:complete